ncbi:TnpV protein [Kocuria rosea]|uniref:TnpV protein n=1 Tax=Kocuria rosea TaxID=1275 RepID=UPI0025B7922B|nr:TnpV protein [Kocuria rosea]WJZ68604.1 TnpV protein [Kocuria rosea]
MNKYGKFAQEAWKATAPAEYALIPDPQAWFESLGEEASIRVDDLMRQLAGPDPVGETFLEKLGRLNASKMQAEEIVRAEMLTPDPSVQEENEEDEDPESGMGRMLRIMQELNREDREYWDEVARQDAEQG